MTGESIEGRAAGAGGVSLHWQLRAPREAWGSLMLVHGLGEHSDRYREVADHLAEEGLSLFSFDLRGHGRSDGLRGDVEAFSSFVEDLLAMEGVWERKTRGADRRFLLGHSLGGLIAIRRLQTAHAPYHAGVFSAPWLRVRLPGWIRRMGTGLGTLFPGLTFPSGIGPGKLTRDPAIAAEWKRDPLVHTRITGRLFREAEGAQEAALRAPGRLDGLPLLFLVPGGDRVVDGAVTLDFAEAIAPGPRQAEILEGRQHEPFNDVGREEVFALLLEWLGAFRR